MHIVQILCVESNMWSFPHTPAYQSERVALKFISITVEQWSKSLLNCNCKCYLHPYIILALFFCFYCYSAHLRWISNGNIFNVKWRLVSGQTVCMHSSVYKPFLHDGKSSKEVSKRRFTHRFPSVATFFSFNFWFTNLNRSKISFDLDFFFSIFLHTVLIASTISSKHILVLDTIERFGMKFIKLFSLGIDFMVNLLFSSS